MCMTSMAWGTPFSRSRMPASIEKSLKLVVCLTVENHRQNKASSMEKRASLAKRKAARLATKVVAAAAVSGPASQRIPDENFTTPR